MVTRGAELEECIAKFELANYLTQTIRDLVKNELKTNSERPRGHERFLRKAKNFQQPAIQSAALLQSFR